MARNRTPRPSVEELLNYDLAVCAWMEKGGGGEVPSVGDDVAPRPFRLAGFDEAGREGTRRPFRLAGFDEAGRGALAGPVVVGAVHFPETGRGSRDVDHLLAALRGLGDSKCLTVRARETLFERIVGCAVCAVGASSAAEIDRVGIVAACRLAASRANARLTAAVDGRLFDRGLSLYEMDDASGRPIDHAKEATATKADGRSLHVAAASVLAKVTRDRWMCQLAERFSAFGLERHKGYGTAAHVRAILDHGVTRIHRRTFLSGIRNAESQSC